MDGLTLDPHPGPLPAYRALVATGTLVADAAQAAAAGQLQDLWLTLRGYDPKPRAAPPPSCSPACAAAIPPRWRRAGSTWSARSDAANPC